MREYRVESRILCTYHLYKFQGFLKRANKYGQHQIKSKHFAAVCFVFLLQGTQAVTSLETSVVGGNATEVVSSICLFVLFVCGHGRCDNVTTVQDVSQKLYRHGVEITVKLEDGCGPTYLYSTSTC